MTAAILTANRRQAWRRLAQMGAQMAERAVASDGREVLQLDDFRRALAMDGKGWIDADAAGLALALSFSATAKALQAADMPRRRAILGAALEAIAKAIDELITDAAFADAERSRRQTGCD